MDTTGKPVEDDRHVPNVVKRILEARRIVGSYTGENSYASGSICPPCNNEDKYKTLVEKLIQLEAND